MVDFKKLLEAMRARRTPEDQARVDAALLERMGVRQCTVPAERTFIGRWSHMKLANDVVFGLFKPSPIQEWTLETRTGEPGVTSSAFTEHRIRIVEGGVTGWEGIYVAMPPHERPQPGAVADPEDLAALGWWACAGTEGRWDALFVPPESMRTVLEAFGFLPAKAEAKR